MNLAHGVGDEHGLPLPLDLVLQGAAVALLTSFLVLGLWWKSPRFTELPEVSVRDLPWLRLLVVVGLVFVPLPWWPRLVFVGMWVGVAFASMLLGPVWRVLNPLRLVLRFSTGRLPYRFGYWPAAVQLLAFTWVELVLPSALPWFLVTYGVVNVAGGALFGEDWFRFGDGFEVYSSLLGRLSPLWGNPFRRLTGPPVPGLVAVVAVCLGSTAVDSLGWETTLALLLGIVVVAVSFRLVAKPVLAYTLIPIIAGYVVAHYYTYLAPAVAVVQVGAVLFGHVVAVIAAHDRTLALTKQRHLTDQVPLLVLMVGYTAGGLALLFTG